MMDLQARDSKAVEARAREEYLLMKRKRTAYFDAVKRANRPSTVTINPALRTQLEHALGINDVEGALSGGLGAELGDVPGDINSYLSYLLQLQQEREDEEEEIYYLPVISSRAKIQTQRDALRGTVQSLLDMGFLESQVILAVETVRREQQDRLLDDMDDYNGLDFVGKLLDCVKSSVLEWLCLHLAEEDLPEGLDLDSNMTNPGISVAPSPFSNSLRDMSRSSSKDTLTLEVNEEVNVGNNTRASNKSGSNSNNKAVTELCKYGWAQEDILSALELCKRATSEYTESSPPDNPSWALLLQVKTMLRNATLAAIEKEDTASSRVSLNLSLSLGVDQMQHKSHAEQGDSSDAGVSIEEECMVLESIFTPENFAVKDYSDGVRHICVNIPVDLLKTSSKEEPNVHLDVYVHPSMNYPAKIPLALLRCPRLRARGVLLNVQSLVWNKLHELRGDSVIFALASWIQDELPDKVAYSLDKRSLSQLPEAGLGTLLAQEACTMWPSSQVHFEALVAGPSGDKGVEQKEDNVVATAKKNSGEGKKRLKGGGPFWRRQLGSALQKAPHRSGREQRLQKSYWGARNSLHGTVEVNFYLRFQKAGEWLLLERPVAVKPHKCLNLYMRKSQMPRFLFASHAA